MNTPLVLVNLKLQNSHTLVLKERDPIVNLSPNSLRCKGGTWKYHLQRSQMQTTAFLEKDLHQSVWLCFDVSWHQLQPRTPGKLRVAQSAPSHRDLYRLSASWQHYSLNESEALAPSFTALQLVAAPSSVHPSLPTATIQLPSPISLAIKFLATVLPSPLQPPSPLISSPDEYLPQHPNFIMYIRAKMCYCYRSHNQNPVCVPINPAAQSHCNPSFHMH